MPDRYDKALQDLEQVTPTDLWDEVARRSGVDLEADPDADPEATSGPSSGVTVIPLRPSRDRAHPSRRTVVAAAVAAVLALALAAGAATYLVKADDRSGTRTVDEPNGPDPAPTAPERETPTTTPRTSPPSTVPPSEPDGAAVPPDPTTTTTTTVPGAAPVPTDLDDPGQGDLASCAQLEFSATGPADLAGVQQPAAAGDPRLHEAARSSATGAFESGDPDRVVFVLASHGFGEDGGRTLTHPVYGDFWLSTGEPEDSPSGLVELSVTLNDEVCPVTLWALGLSGSEVEAFAMGLETAH